MPKEAGDAICVAIDTSPWSVAALTTWNRRIERLHLEPRMHTCVVRTVDITGFDALQDGSSAFRSVKLMIYSPTMCHCNPGLARQRRTRQRRQQSINDTCDHFVRHVLAGCYPAERVRCGPVESSAVLAFVDTAPSSAVGAVAVDEKCRQ